MSNVHGIGSKLFLGGAAVSAYVGSADLQISVETAEVSGFEHTHSQYRRGPAAGTFSAGGVAPNVAASGLPEGDFRDPFYMSLALAPATRGSHAFLMRSRVTSVTKQNTISDAAMWNVDAELSSENGDWFCKHGRLLYNGTFGNGSDSGTTELLTEPVDLGSAGASVAIVHLLSRTGGALTQLSVEHGADSPGATMNVPVPTELLAASRGVAEIALPSPAQWCRVAITGAANTQAEIAVTAARL